jgi:riboflavin biosynthesis pyrimidine reductase
LLTHALRSEFDAILIGGNTFRIDNPRLNNRLWKNKKKNQDEDHDTTREVDKYNEEKQSIIPVILDTHLNHIIKLIHSKQVISCAVSNPNLVIVCCHQQAYDQYHKEILEYCTAHNVCIKLQPCECNPTTSQLELKDVMEKLHHNHGIESIMVEGGASILSSFLSNCRDLVDCVCVTIFPRWIGKRGLNALADLTLPQKQDGATCEEETMEFLSNSEWFPLGPDCIYLAFTSQQTSFS